MKNTDRFFHAKQEWERLATVQLYQEYKQALSLRRIQMRPAAIEIFDSETRWGEWDVTTRRIRLSRKLLTTHNWFQVVGILLHEMAHQLVDEEAGEFGLGANARSEAGDGEAAHGETAHGPAFRKACYRLGVPAEFSKASADLQSHSFDWRDQVRDEATEKMLDKVKKLLALAESSNENEALLAMNRVRELYAKHNLENLSTHANDDRIHIILSRGSKRIESYEQQIVGILVGHFFVEVLSGQLYDAPSGEHHRAFEIIGSRENAIMAEYVYHFLSNQSEFLLNQADKAAFKTRGFKFSRLERKSYRMGILRGFASKLQASEESASRRKERGDIYAGASSNAAQASASDSDNVVSRALMAFAKDRSLKDYVGHIYPRLRRGKGSAQSIDPSAYSAGQTVGKTLSIHRPITSEGPRGKLLR